jgi:hypothetical protein
VSCAGPPSCLSHNCLYCWNTPPTASLCSHPLFDLRKRSVSVDKCVRVCIHMKEFNDTSAQTFLSGTNFSDCPSAEVCGNAKQPTKYWREGSTSTAIPPASASSVVDQCNKIGDITFGVTVPEIREQLGIPEEGERLPLESVVSRLFRTMTEEISVCIPVTCKIWTQVVYQRVQ